MEWSISGEQLGRGLRSMVEGKKVVHVYARFGGSGPALGGRSDGGTRVLSCGLLWEAGTTLDPDAMADKGAWVCGTAGMWVSCHAPLQLGQVIGIADACMRLAVHRWEVWSGALVYKLGFGGVMETRRLLFSLPLGQYEPRASRWVASVASV